jgi:hypothetical protein
VVSSRHTNTTSRLGASRVTSCRNWACVPA